MERWGWREAQSEALKDVLEMWLPSGESDSHGPGQHQKERKEKKRKEGKGGRAGKAV